MNIRSLGNLIKDLQQAVHQIQNQLHFVVEPSVEAGLIIHLAFLVESLLKDEETRRFPDLVEFQRQYRLEADQVRTILMPIERNNYVRISEDEIAFLLKAFIENHIESVSDTYTVN